MSLMRPFYCFERMYKAEFSYFTLMQNRNKMKKHKRHHTVGTIPKSNIKTVGRSKNDTPNTQVMKYMTTHCP